MATIILGLAGGLGLFLYGMNLMSDGIEKAAGDKLRHILEVFTKNKLSGLLVGIVFTGIIQSSSAATVMVVSFVNAGLMDLYQACGIVFGANIGTTVTSQLVSFNLSAIAPLFLFAGVIMVSFINNTMVKKVGEVVLGFGILFTGLTTMKDTMAFLKSSEAFVSFLSGLRSPFLAIFIGFAITSILQSSSVTVSILLLMASQGLIELQMCFFIVLGCNIGACSSALLASLNGKKMAKRAALIHFLFNVIGSAIFFVALLFIKDPLADFIIKFSGGDMGRAVANTHTSFKIVQVIMLFPFSNWIVKMTYALVRGTDDEEDVADNEPMYIGEHSLQNIVSAVPQATLEIERVGNMAIQSLEDSMTAFLNESMEDTEKIYKQEENINAICGAILDYLVKVNQNLSLPISDKKIMGGLFHIVNDIERIADHAKDIADLADNLISKDRHISVEAKEELIEMYQLTDELLLKALYTLKHRDDKYVNDMLDLESQVDEYEIKLQKRHIKRLAKQLCEPNAGLVFSDIITRLERVADHGMQIAYITLSDNTNLLDDETIREFKNA
ncbi:MAG: Na/Pi cotransporter family protein [Lachnospiraceae bacterium]|nr:Na/Pi cotransporter family protein [Lachnospiraceae bacterium]